MLQDQISSHSHSEERSMLRLGLASDGATLSLTRLADFHRRSFSRSLSTPALAKKSDEDASDVVIEAGAVERDGDGSRLTLAAQPATNRLMEALVGSRMPSEPLYDLPSWLEHSYPQFDASPKTNLFSWQVWSRHHLTKEKQRSLLAFHQYMSHDHFRRVIIRRSNLELARLWDWQQQRADLGLSPDLTPEEVSKIKTKILQNSPTETSSPLPSPLEALAESSPSSPVAPASSPDSPPRGGILGIIHSKDKDSKKKVVESKSKGLATSHLSPAQRSVVDMMRNPKVEVQELAAAFLSRRKRGEDFMDMVSRFPAGQRVKEILSQELERRRAVDVLGRDDGSSSGLEVKSQLYQSPKERVSGGRKVEVEEAEEGKISLSPLNPLELKREVTGSKSWMETKILDRNIKFLSEKSLIQSTRQMVERDAAMAKSDVVEKNDDLPFDPLLRPTTATLDQVHEYLEMRYADLLHQKIQAVETSSAASSTLARKTTASSLPSPEMKVLNDQAQSAFDAIQGRDARRAQSSYIKQMNGFHNQGLISKHDLALCLRAAEIKAIEASEPLTHSNDLLSLITCRPSSVIGKLKDSEVSAAKALWESSIKSYASWSPKLLQLAQADDVQKSTVVPDGIRKWVSAPISFQEACESWDRVVRQSGVAHAPSLAHVIFLDNQLRTQQQPSSELASGLQAQAIADMCRKIYESVVSSAKTAQGNQPADSALMSWDKIMEVNAKLDLKEPSSFILQPVSQPKHLSVSGMIEAHFELLRKSVQLDIEASNSHRRLDDLWSGLLKAMASIQSQDVFSLQPSIPSQTNLNNQSDAGRVESVEASQAKRLGSLSIKQTLLLGPEPSEIQDSNRVELRVKAQRLKGDAGLNDAGIQLILDVCGEERWDEQRQEIIISCSRYSTREENKRVCLEQLMKLIIKARSQ